MPFLMNQNEGVVDALERSYLKSMVLLVLLVSGNVVQS